LNQIYVVTARAPGQLVDRACGVIYESAPLAATRTAVRCHGRDERSHRTRELTVLR